MLLSSFGIGLIFAVEILPFLPSLLLFVMMPTISVLFAVTDQPYWPFVVLAISVTFIVVAISWWRFHAFVALLLACLVAGMLSHRDEWKVVDKAGKEISYSHWVAVIELTSKGLGDTTRDVAISIALASIIGMALMESGAADKVVRRFLSLCGDRLAGFALLWATYVLSIPIFFDTMFMLMAPLAMALRMRTGRDYLLYVMCICCGGMITHSMTIPHPGPIAMVDTLKIDAGVSLIAGLVGGLVPAFLGYFACVWLNKKVPVPLRYEEALSERSEKPESELPSFFWSILPVILPIVLISGSSLFRIIADGATGAEENRIGWCVQCYELFGGQEGFASLRGYVDFFGNKNLALAIGTAIAVWVLARQQKFAKGKLEKLIARPLETAGMIILITSAGGAFGFVLRSVGVGDAVKAYAEGRAISLVLLSYLVAIVIRIAQGSATVAMLTTASMVAPMLGDDLEFNRVYIYLAIGWGSMACSWMNDSGFWVVNRLSGMTQRETLQSWTVLSTFLSVSGIIVTLIASKVLPLVTIN